MASELLIGLLGIGVGAATALIAAFMTARGSEQQAAAQREQAVAGYKAALDSAREQVRAAMTGQARDARRPVYAEFLRSTHDLIDAVHVYVLDPESDVDAYNRVLGRARKAYAELELEGPDHITTAGRRAVDEAIAVRKVGCGYASVIRAVNKASRLSESPATRDLGIEIDGAIWRIRNAAHRLPEAWRGRARSCWDRPERWESWQAERDQTPEGAPPDLFATALFTALDEAKNGCMRAATEAGALSAEDDVWRLYWAAIHWPDHDPIEYVRSLMAPADEAVLSFVTEARAVLHAPIMERSPLPNE